MGKLLFLVIVLCGAFITAWKLVSKDPLLRAEQQGTELDDANELLDDVEEINDKAAKLEQRLNQQQPKGGNDDQMDRQPTEES